MSTYEVAAYHQRLFRECQVKAVDSLQNLRSSRMLNLGSVHEGKCTYGKLSTDIPFGVLTSSSVTTCPQLLTTYDRSISIFIDIFEYSARFSQLMEPLDCILKQSQ